MFLTYVSLSLRYGFLGSKNRLRSPLCVLNCLREIFPLEKYLGYLDEKEPSLSQYPSLRASKGRVVSRNILNLVLIGSVNLEYSTIRALGILFEWSV